MNGQPPAQPHRETGCDGEFLGFRNHLNQQVRPPSDLSNLQACARTRRYLECRAFQSSALGPTDAHYEHFELYQAGIDLCILNFGDEPFNFLARYW
jgi:hypothetical protein